MPPPRISILSPLVHSRFHHVHVPRAVRPNNFLAAAERPQPPARQLQPLHARTFTTTRANASWLIPRRKLRFKDSKGRPRFQRHGSVRGTTVVWGEYGLRMRDRDRRISAHQLRNGEEVIRRRLRGTNFRLYTRISAGTAVFTKGNESRMGTGKGTFDHWAARVGVSKIIFEVTTDAHEQVVRDALRLAANKMPGLYEFVRKGDPPVMGLTKLGPTVTPEMLHRPRKKLPAEETAQRLPGPSEAGIKAP